MITHKSDFSIIKINLFNIYRISDEVDDSNRSAPAEKKSIDGIELVHAEREIVEVEETTERMRLELNKTRVIRYDQCFEVWQVAKCEHLNFR